MIDLHIHTKCSSGAYSVSEVLVMAQKKGLKTISITDHDNCKAYYELENPDIRKLFDGNIKTGIEITTSYLGARIELLAYDFSNYEVIDKYFVDAKANIDWESIMLVEIRKLLEKIKELDIKYDSIFDDDLLIKRYESKLYESILLLNDNDYLREKLGVNYCENGREFFRKCISNPNSLFYIDYGKYRPKIEDILNLIHQYGGKVFLAHPYAYKFDNTEEFIEKLYNEYNLDGIECYYSGFNEEQTEYIKQFAKDKNLLISGGSDYHGTDDRNNEIGMCMLGTQYIPSSILNDWYDIIVEE